jgi:CubicO group peptidase (beta-lactamase class C family)
MFMRSIFSAALMTAILAAPAARADDRAAMAARVADLVPALEAYVEKYMAAFDVPGTAVGIVVGDELVYAKGFGVREKGGAPVDTKTVFQIGSTTKAFLATTIAIAVDKGKLAWDDRIVDLHPSFQMKDPWVTREFRVFDLLAQRSGLPPYANDAIGLLGYDEDWLIRSLRHVEPVSSFRSTFAYTNITHMLAGEVVSAREGAAGWNALVKREILDPLGMTDSSTTAAAIMAAPNHAEGYLFTPGGSVKVPFTQTFPYDFGGAGDINSSVEDMQHWLRLQIGDGVFAGKRLVSSQNLAFTRIPKVGMTDRIAYAYGWVIQQTPNGTIVWHNGGTTAFGAFVGLQLDRRLGIVVLSNQANVGFPDAVGEWALARLLGNPDSDPGADKLAAAKAAADKAAKLFARPDDPRPFPPLAPLAGDYASPAFGKAAVRVEGEALVMRLAEVGAELKLEPWDGGIMTARLVPEGKFAAIVANQGPLPLAFVEPRMDKEGKLSVLRLSFDDGQAYEYTRE